MLSRLLFVGAALVAVGAILELERDRVASMAVEAVAALLVWLVALHLYRQGR